MCTSTDNPYAGCELDLEPEARMNDNYDGTLVLCLLCRGTKVCPVYLGISLSSVDEERALCSKCDGTGLCQGCEGRGWVLIT